MPEYRRLRRQSAAESVSLTSVLTWVLKAGTVTDNDLVFERWRERRSAEGRRVGLLELYAMVAESRGLDSSDLSQVERYELTAKSQPVFWPGFEQVSPFRSDGAVEVVPYDPSWKTTFDDLKNRLAGELGNLEARIEHIGSTAIVGLTAKPIVDILLSVIDLANEEKYRSACESLGFDLYTRDDAHRFFAIPSPRPRTAQIHVCQFGSSFEREHLLFRDFLIASADARNRYLAAKQRASQEWAHDRIGYTYAKNSTIVDLLDEAELWAVSTKWTP